MEDRRGPDLAVVLLVLVAVLFLVLIAFALSMGFSHQPVMGGPMMGGGTGEFPTSNLVVAFGAGVLVALLLAAAFLRTRQPRPVYVVAPPPLAHAPAQAQPTPVTSDAAARQVEAAVVRMLREDERIIYTKVRDAGGQMLQKDLVASGGFSKAKVSRVLDRLERRGLAVRERHGMTNRVRLTPPR